MPSPTRSPRRSTPATDLRPHERPYEPPMPVPTTAAMPVEAAVTSDALHARVRAMIHAFEGGRPSPESFDALAADLAAFQAAHVPGYARLCAARGVDPRAIVRASQAPAVPAEAFKLASVFA